MQVTRVSMERRGDILNLSQLPGKNGDQSIPPSVCFDSYEVTLSTDASRIAH